MRRVDTELVVQQFHRTVNMPSDDLRRWLRTEASRRATRRGAGGAARDGQRIAVLRRTPPERLTTDDLRTMFEVVQTIRRRATRAPARPDRLESHWRHALMNLGHDPLKDRYVD